MYFIRLTSLDEYKIKILFSIEILQYIFNIYIILYSFVHLRHVKFIIEL